MTSHRPLGVFAAAVVALALPFAAPLLRAGIYVGNNTDLFSYQLPLRRMVRASLLAGDLPLWNPWILGGVPALAAWQLGLLYPPAWLTLLLPAAWGVDVDRALHGAWLVAGGFALGNALGRGPLLRLSLPGAIVAVWLAGCGVTWSHIYAGHVSFLATWAWVPWLWALALRALRGGSMRVALAAGAAWAMALLAGHPQVATMGAFGLATVGAGALWMADAADALAGRWRRTVGLAGALLLGTGLAAVQLLPAALVVPELNRGLDGEQILGLAYSPPVAALATLLAPEAFGPVEAKAAAFSWHEAVGGWSAGLVALAAAGVAATGRARVWAGGLALMLLWVPGSSLPMLGACIDVVPALGSFRVPSRWLAPATLLAALIAAEAVRCWLPPAMPLSGDPTAPAPQRGPSAPRAAAVAAGAIALLWLTAALTIDDRSGWWSAGVRADIGGEQRRAWAQATVRAIALGGVWAAAAAAAWTLPGWRRPLIVAALAVALWDALAMVQRVQPASSQRPAVALDWPAAAAATVASALSSDGQRQGRLVTAASTRHANWGGAHGVAVAGGYETAMPLWSNVFLNFGAGRQPDRYVVNAQIRRPSPWLDRMAARLLWRPADDTAAGRAFAGWRTIASAQGQVLQANPAPLPRAHVAAAVRVVADRSAAIAALASVPADTTLLDRDLAVPMVAGTQSHVRIVEDRNHEVTLTVDGPSPAVAILRDTWMQGWEATVDGVPCPTAIADGVFRAAAVPAGRHTLRWRYRPPGLALGAMISLSCVLVWLMAWRRAGRSQAAAPRAARTTSGPS